LDELHKAVHTSRLIEPVPTLLEALPSDAHAYLFKQFPKIISMFNGYNIVVFAVL
jgi:hypothetical protein